MLRASIAVIAGVGFGAVVFGAILLPLGFWPVFQDEQFWVMPIVSAAAVAAELILLVRRDRSRPLALLGESLLFSLLALVPLPTVSWSPAVRHVYSQKNDTAVTLAVFAAWATIIGLVSWLLALLFRYLQVRKGAVNTADNRS